MHTHRRLMQFFSILVILTMLFSGLPYASAQGPDGIERQVNAQTGKVSFIGSDSEGGQAVSARDALGDAARPQDPAMALAKRFGPEFGLQDPARDLVEVKDSRSENGRITTRYQQNHQGIPIMGGELIVNTNTNGDLYSMNGEVSSNLSLSTKPAVDSEQARQTALQAVAKWYEKSPEDFMASEPELWIYDESLLRSSTRPAELVWRMDVTAVDMGMPVRELVLVNAQRGSISLHFNQIDTAWTVKGSSGAVQDPDPTPTSLPTETPLPTETSIPTETQIPTETSIPTETVEATATVISTEETIATEEAEATDVPAMDVAALDGATWYVATTGNDANSCSTPEFPCATINAAISKAADGNQIYISSGRYKNLDPASLYYVVTIGDKQLSLYGGWNAGFGAQTGFSVIDAEKKFGGINIYGGSSRKTVRLDRLHIRNGLLGGVSFSFTDLMITNSSIYNNSSIGTYSNGGGIDSYYGSLTARNVTIANNTTSGQGGGIYDYGGSLNLNNVTITNNSANWGGGVSASLAGNSGSLRVSNSILFGNTASVEGPDCYWSSLTSDHTIIGNTANCQVSATNGNQLNVNPKLGRFIEETGYQPLLSGSPAINAGLNCFGAGDQRGVARVGNCDIGAYEYDALGPATKIVIAAGINQRAAPGSLFSNPLYAVVLDDNGSPLSGQTVTFQGPLSGPGALFTANNNTSLAITTGNDGIAAAEIRANDLSGNYVITASSPVGSVNFELENLALYVSNNGNDENDCLSPQQACFTINAAINKAQSGDTILVATGTYTNVGTGQVVHITKDVTIEGGWDAGFTVQNGFSVLDGQKTRRGIYSAAFITATISRFVIQNGESWMGGGVYNESRSLTIDSTTIKNSVSTGDGGAIHNRGGLVLQRSLIGNNRTEGSGGGIRSIFGSLTIRNSAIYGNFAEFFGGGIDTSSASLKNVTIVGNSAWNGGGIYANQGQVGLNNVTISNNEAVDVGGGISSFGSGSSIFKVQNSVLANNMSGSAPDCAGMITSQGYNIITSISDCTITPKSSDQFNIDPKAGVFLPEPGVLPLLPGSPAINHGNPATCLPTDQRGVARVGTCDVGAYEYTTPLSPASIVIVSGDEQRTPPNFAFMLPLRVGVVDENGSPVSGVEVTITSPGTGPSAAFQNDSHSVSLSTDGNGIVTTKVKANDLSGSYNITASTDVGSIDFNLENIAWYVSSTGNDTNDCQSPVTSCATIIAALNKAEINDTILVASATYLGTGSEVLKLSKDIRLSGGWNTSFTTQDGYSILDGENMRSGIVVEPNTTATLETFIVEHGRNDAIQRGGIANDGNLTLIDCDIRYNSSAWNAGGIMNRGELTIRDSFVRHNSGIDGGGIYNQGVLTVTNTAITDNSAAEGGGIYNTDFNGPGNATLGDVIIENNRSVGDGGGIYASSTILISNTRINNNSAGSRGGGMINHGNATLRNVSVVGNDAVQGGGIEAGGSIILNNSTVSGNTSFFGGGIFVLDTGSARLKNTILAGNTARKSGPDCSGTLLSSGSNIIANTSSCVMSLSTGDRVNINPQLGVFLPDEGYIPLLPTSPAVDAGNPATCTSTDQRGVARPQGAKCDIGAYEYTLAGPLVKLEVAGGSEQLTLVNTAFRKPLQVVALDAKGSPVSEVSVTFEAPPASPSGRFAGTNTNTAVLVTNGGGIAQPASFTADGTMGTYNVIASAPGVASQSMTLHNGPWLVVPASNGGNDSNDCMNPETACASLGGVLSKDAFQEGDTVWMAVGTYGSSSDKADIRIGKAVNIYGGWNTSFTAQIGTSTIQDTLQFEGTSNAVLHRLTIQNTGFHGIGNAGNLILKESTIRNNLSGIVNAGHLTIIKSTITQNGGNEIGDSEGGIHNGGIGSEQKSSVTILDSTITKNKGDTYGGVGNYSTGTVPIRIKNSIIAGNTALYGPPYSPDCVGKFISDGYNIIGNTGNNNTDLCDGVWQSTDRVGYYLYSQQGQLIRDNSINPLLNTLKDFGNNVWVHPLMFGSPAIDAGPWNCDPIDQRGVIRPQGGSCDIGAFEYEFKHNLNSLLITTYNAGNTLNTAKTKVCDQTDLACTAGDAHAKSAHKYAAGIYNLYKNTHSRNSLDGNGIEILSSVHYGSNYQNAFWNGHMMVYGDGYGYPLADDVVAHEFTHGVTQYESNLFYYYQSGAINESFSDLWGEYYDQSNGLGTDTTTVKWLIGENVSGQGATRSMSNPPAYNDPDKMSSSFYYEGIDDSGGVHTNSGVNNKAVYLMVNGGTFNGKTVTALGWGKTTAIYYEVNTNLLSSGADYSDLYYALQQACSNLVGQKGITAGNCVEVKDAVDAVEMNGQPASNFNTHAPLCTVNGTAPKITFADDLETGTKKWTFNKGDYVRWQWDSPYGAYAQFGNRSLYADDYPAGIADASARLATLTIPNNAYLHFAHTYDFERSSYYFDGGVLEYSINSGATWLDAGSLIDYNGYKGKIYGGYGNPLKNRTAFVGSSHGYISTRLNLASLAGKKVSFRWRMGLDEAGYAWGWWVDNVKVYTCEIPQPVISGNAGVGGAKLTYTGGSTTADSTGNYSFKVPLGWSGTVTPSKSGYLFTPPSKTYSNVTADKAAQNYTATRLYSISGNTGAAGVTMSYIDGTEKTVTSQANGKYSFIVPANWSGTVTPSHACYTFDPVNQTYTDLAGNQTSQDYTRTLEAGSECADIDVEIKGIQQGRYGLLPGASTRTSFANVDNGPVKIESTNVVPLMAAERLIYNTAGGAPTSFSEMMALPNNQLDTTYWLPWYNSKTLDTQLRLANVSGADATVQITIGDVAMEPFTITAGASVRKTYANIDKGPVQIVSDQDIVAAERVIYKVNGVETSFTEMMAMPASQLDTTYWLPWYNSKTLDTQIRIANVSGLEANIQVTVGDVDMEPITLAAGGSVRKSFPNLDKGPVQVVSGQDILVSERVIQSAAGGTPISFSEMMALPAKQLDTTYWLPWYNSKTLDTQVRIANVNEADATVQIWIGGVDMGSFTLPAGTSTRKNFPNLDKGPVQIVSDIPVVVSERVIYNLNGVPTSFSEMMAMPEGLLDTIYWLPWYNNKGLDTQLRFAVP